MKKAVAASSIKSAPSPQNVIKQVLNNINDSSISDEEIMFKLQRLLKEEQNAETALSEELDQLRSTKEAKEQEYKRLSNNLREKVQAAQKEANATEKFISDFQKKELEPHMSKIQFLHKKIFYLRHMLIAYDTTEQYNKIINKLEKSLTSVLADSKATSKDDFVQLLYSIVDLVNHDKDIVQLSTMYTSLLAHTRRTFSALRVQIQGELEKLLDSVNWGTSEQVLISGSSASVAVPNSFSPSHPQFERFSSICELLTHVQCLWKQLDLIELVRKNKKQEAQDDSTSRIELWIIESLAKPFVIRFKYHFSGTKKTNRLDKPEWFLSFASKTFQENSAFIMDHVQPCLIPVLKYQKKYSSQAWWWYRRSTASASSETVVAPVVQTNWYIDAVGDFMNILIRQAQQKVAKCFEFVKDCTSDEKEILFLHIIHELLMFDQHTKEQNNMLNCSIVSVLQPFLTDHDIIKNWKRLDRITAQKAISAEMGDWTQKSDMLFKDILKGMNVDDLKPSNSAYTLIHTLHALNERYRHIPDPDVRRRFINDIHLVILKEYLSTLSGSTEGKSLMKGSVSSLLSATTKLTTQRDTPTLCSMINSALYCETTLRDWQELEYFIALKSMQDERFGIFDVIADEFTKCADQMTRELIKTLLGNMKFQIARKYQTALAGDGLNISSTTSGNSISAEMYQVAASIRTELASVNKSIQMARFNMVWTGLAAELDKFFCQQVAEKPEEMNEKRIKQFLNDANALTAIVFGDYSKKPINFFPQLKKLFIKHQINH